MVWDGQRAYLELTLKAIRLPQPAQKTCCAILSRRGLLEPCAHDDHAILGAQRHRKDPRSPWKPGGPQAPGAAEVLPRPFRSGRQPVPRRCRGGAKARGHAAQAAGREPAPVQRPDVAAGLDRLLLRREARLRHLRQLPLAVAAHLRPKPT